jgi:UDP:flavonoid glycosyltransferase YjiC (YdhE family)
MRVAVVVCGSRGDVQPMLALAVRLQATGHAAVLCASPDNEAWARSHGCAFEAIGEPLRDNASLGRWGFAAFNRFIRRQIHLQVRDLPRVLEGCDARRCVRLEGPRRACVGPAPGGPGPLIGLALRSG